MIGAVGVDPAVAEERPVAAGLLLRASGRSATIRISSLSRPARARTRPKGSATNEPPQNSRPPSAGPFVADPVDGRDEHAVGDRVGPLHRLPGVGLGLAELGLLGGVPADGGGVEQDLGPLQGRQPGGLGIPLVPADERADAWRAVVSNAWKPRSPGVK